MYNFMLFLHVLMAITWVGGNIILQILGTRLAAANEPAQLASFARQVEWIGTRILTPAALLLLVMGVLMVFDRWSFDLLWVTIGMAGFAYSFINGAVFVGPTTGKTSKLMDERGPEDTTVQANIRKLFIYSRIELVILLVVVAAMTLKPTL
jgi:uncharacterized membrane protein